MKKHFLLLMLLLSICSIYSFGQASKEFWFVAPDITSGHNAYAAPYSDCDGGMPVFLNISAMSLATQVVISQPANPSFTPIVINLNAHEDTSIDLSYCSDSASYGLCNTQYPYPGFNTIENSPFDSVNNYGILIESEQIITAFYEVRRTNNPDIWSLKGDNALGQDFWVPTQIRYNNQQTWFNPDPWNEIHIVATEDNTTVTITPSQDCQKNGGGTLAAGVTFSVVLHQGQTYGLRANSQLAVNHLSGTHITSDKDIAVTQSDDSQSGPGGCADVNGDQIVPVSLIGTEYIVAKGQLNFGEYAFILATVDNTEIYTNGNAVPITTIDQGETYQLLLVQAHIFIRTSKPAYIYHENGFGCEVGGALLPSITCTGSTEVYFTRTSPEPFFLNIMVPQGGEDDFWIEYDDGTTQHIDQTWFEPVVGTGTAETPETWMALKPNVNSGAAFDTLINSQEVTKVYNTSEYFHLGIYYGGPATGCSYGYFSDFSGNWNNREIAIESNYYKVCFGDALQFDESSWGGLTYNWSRMGGGPTYLSDTSIADPIAIIPNAGVYDYQVDITGKCDRDTTINLTVKMPDSLSADFSVTESIIHTPDSLQIIDNSVGEDLRYVWDFGDSQAGANSDSSFYHFYDSTYIDTVLRIKLVLWDVLDCIDTASNFATVLAYYPYYNFYQQEEICDGDSLLWRTKYYSTTGTFYDSLRTSHNRDSVFELDLIVNSKYLYSQEEEICNGDSLLWHNKYYSASNTYYDSLTTINDCDSIYELVLIVNPAYSFLEYDTICNGDSLIWHNKYYSAIGTYYDSLSTISGCDSIYELQLRFYPDYHYTQQEELCNGDSLLWHGKYYLVENTYYDSLSTIYGCDSVFELEIIHNPNYFYTQEKEICNGDSIFWHNNYYSSANTYYDSVITIKGCDSIYKLVLIVNPVYSFSESYTICNGDSLLWHGNYYSEIGIYHDNIKSINDCDSIFEMQLSSYPNYFFTQSEEFCLGDSILWRNKYYKEIGSHYDSLTSINGCDSIYELVLLINPDYLFIQKDSICIGDSVLWQNSYYSSPGAYYSTTVKGCDSILMLDLKINPVYSFSEYDTICNEEQSLWRGNIFYNDGIYYDNLKTINGCDSIYILHLTVHPQPPEIPILGELMVNNKQLEIYSISADSLINYKWEIKDGVIINQISIDSVQVQWIYSDGLGYLSLVSMNQFDCIEDTTIQVYITSLGINLLNNNDVKIYPNPVKDILFVDYDNEFTMELFSITGIKLLISQNTQTDITSLSSGVYIILIKDSKDEVIKIDKLIKE